MDKLSRRDFLKLSAADAGGGGLLMAAGLGPAEAGGSVGDGNTTIPEFKAFLVDIRKA